MVPTVRRIGLAVAVVALAVGAVACGGGNDEADAPTDRKAAGGDVAACLVNTTPAQVRLSQGADEGGGCAAGPTVKWSYDAGGRPFDVVAFVQRGAPVARLQQDSGAYDFCQNFHEVANGPALTVGVRGSPYQITSRRLDGDRLAITLEPGTSKACD